MNWKSLPLKRVASVMPSNVDKHSVEGELPIQLCNYVDVYRNERITSGMEFMLATASDAQISRFSLKAQDVLVTKDSEEPTDIGVPAYVPADIQGVVCGYHLAILRPNAERLFGAFLHWALQSEEIHAYYSTAATGISRYALSVSDLASTPLKLPMLGEQIRIAAFLDEKTARIDALIAEKERLAHKVKEYEQAEISRLLTEGLSGAVLWETGSIFVPLAPEGWRLVAFKRAMHGMEQGWSPQCENRPADENEWGVLKVGCVNGTQFAPRENKALPVQLEPDMSCVLHRGDVLVSRANTRELVGLAALVDDDFPNLLLCDKLYRLHLRGDWVLPAYAVLALRSNASRRQIELGASGASSSMQNISQEVIRELVVALPPLEEQADIVGRCTVIRRNCSDLGVHVEKHISRLREYRSSLISAAVTGQLDLPSISNGNEKWA